MKACIKLATFGRVKSFQLKVPRILQATINRGYLRVGLHKDNFSQYKFIHILVAETFIPNIEHKPFVNHKDGNKQNNFAENLEWVTNSENMKHAYKLGLNKPRIGYENFCAKLTIDDVKYIRKNYKLRDKDWGARALAKKFNVSESTITNVVKGRTYRNVID